MFTTAHPTASRVEAPFRAEDAERYRNISGDHGAGKWWKLVPGGLHPHTLPACQLLDIWSCWNPLDRLGLLLDKQTNSHLSWNESGCFPKLPKESFLLSRKMIKQNSAPPRLWKRTPALPWVTLKQPKKVAGFYMRLIASLNLGRAHAGTRQAFPSRSFSKDSPWVSAETLSNHKGTSSWITGTRVDQQH